MTVQITRPEASTTFEGVREMTQRAHPQPAHPQPAHTQPAQIARLIVKEQEMRDAGFYEGHKRLVLPQGAG